MPRTRLEKRNVKNQYPHTGPKNDSFGRYKVLLNYEPLVPDNGKKLLTWRKMPWKSKVTSRWKRQGCQAKKRKKGAMFALLL